MVDDGGLSRLQARFRAIPEAVKANVRKTMEQVADEIVSVMKSLAPVDEGDLRDSIGWTWGAAPAGTVSVKAQSVGDMTITIYAGSEKAHYARFVEFGTQGGTFGQRVADPGAGIKQAKKGRKSYRTHPGTAAQPFFFPAYRLSKKRAVSRIKSAISRAIRKNRGGT